MQYLTYCICTLLLSVFGCRANKTHNAALVSIEQIQDQNIKNLAYTLPLGWKSFCTTAVDEGVMSLFGDNNPNAARIYLLTLNNQSVELPIRAMSQLSDFNISRNRRTLIYVNAFYTPDSTFRIEAHLRLLQASRDDYNIIVVDFVQNFQQLYFSVRQLNSVQAYYIARLLQVLINNNFRPNDIVLAGHSVGANIAALGAKYFNAQNSIDKLSLLVAVDPALMCDEADIHVARNITTQVVVIHGENNIFSVEKALGDIDIYVNSEKSNEQNIEKEKPLKMQPGCSNALCNHMYTFVLFMEALNDDVQTAAFQCENWTQYIENRCHMLHIGLNYTDIAPGLYFSVSQRNPPYVFTQPAESSETMGIQN